MKSSAYAVSRMKPMYQARKKTVPGRTNDFRFLTSSWNSGDRSIASQSTSRTASCRCPDASTLSPPSMGCPRGSSSPLCAPLTLLLPRALVLAARRRDLLGLRLGLRRAAAAALLHLPAARLAHLGRGRPRDRLARRPRGREPVGPATGEQQRHRPEPER